MVFFTTIVEYVFTMVFFTMVMIFSKMVCFITMVFFQWYFSPCYFFTDYTIVEVYHWKRICFGSPLPFASWPLAIPRSMFEKNERRKTKQTTRQFRLGRFCVWFFAKGKYIISKFSQKIETYGLVC